VRVRGVLASMAVSAALLATAACGGDVEAGPTTFAPRPSTGLAARLETPPPSSAGGTSAWARTYRPSVSQYVDHFYAERARGKVKAALRQQRMQEIAHVLWIEHDIQSDVVVLRFADGAGAAAQLTAVRAPNEAADDRDSFTVQAPGTPVVYYDTAAGDKGFRLARGYAQVGVHLVELFVYYPGALPRAQIERTLRAQLALLS
jgi:hypothetical protein